MGRPASRSRTSRLADLLRWARCQRNPLDAFNTVLLRRGAYWKGQREMAAAIADPTVKTVAVRAGHSVGKSFSAAGFILGWLALMPESLVISTSPSNAQLSGVLWKEIARARSGAPLLRGMGRLRKLPNQLDLGDGWQALGYSTNKAERIQGFHAAGGQLFVVVDEASGVVDPEIWATLASLKPDKYFLISNPLRAHGHFYDQCKRGEDGDKTVRLIVVPSTASPDIDLPRSARGLADRGFLDDMRAQYGEGSQTWNCRVLAMFPDGLADELIPGAWLELAGRTLHIPAGPRRLSIDLAGGGGGDSTVILVRDDAGILHWEASNRLTPEAAALRVAELCARFGVVPDRVTYDAMFRGADFATLLVSVGMNGCRPYYGNTPSKDPRYENLRGGSYFTLRARLDPARMVPARPGSDVLIPQAPFAIPRDFLDRLRRELRQLTHEPGKKRTVHLRTKEEMAAALRHSPDYSDALAMSFAYPYV